MARVNLTLNGAKVTPEFRAQTFDAANKAGVSVNEYALLALGEKLLRSGRNISGIFDTGDVDDLLQEIQL